LVIRIIGQLIKLSGNSILAGKAHEMEEMKKQLKSIFAEWREGKFKDFHPDWDYVAQFERRKLVQKMAGIFDEVVAKRSLQNL